MKELRLSKGITIEELSLKTGISPERLLAYENQTIDIMKEDVCVAVAICNALGIGMEEFLNHLNGFHGYSG